MHAKEPQFNTIKIFFSFFFFSFPPHFLDFAHLSQLKSVLVSYSEKKKKMSISPRRPPSPAPSNSSVASTTSSLASTVTTSFKKKMRDRPLKVKAVLDPENSLAVRYKRGAATVEECMEFVSRPHSSWDSAMKELARLETIKEDRERAMSDTSSCMSGISAYSVATTTSTRTGFGSSSVQRKGNMAKLPSSPPPPPPDLMVVASSSSSSLSLAGSTRSSILAAGPAGGRSGAVRSNSNTSVNRSGGGGVVARGVVGGGGGLAVSGVSPPPARETNHPSSAPARPGQQGGGPQPPPTFTFVQGFVPKIAPKRNK